ncbi:Yip1 domain member 6 protein [Ichthyophthirius multifiliis]|uniref:Protein YIPF n=1 Tax=Ichthyophthirius multifiliis TaxID=5932 RepID=G0QXD8_ICHMU|nr:Yip1 domain member 6 protein [Ichthyophthirius multifiliis]EGR30118.1 Yip1 domain member 6 protein [Ichthyophthirius multifiliis]|eukprot:XP_004031354.1 Yip1 domain member 6 protein [Ichthyophthirius multifiliis]
MIQEDNISNNQQDFNYNIALENDQPKAISNQQKANLISTIDEPIKETIMRDLRMIALKLKYVILPRNDQDKIKQLRNWDLWGPLVLCLALAITLCIKTEERSEYVFVTIFVVIWIGAGFVTLNTKLLGGKISFFQSVCILGYCVFPINISSFISLFLFKEYIALFIIKVILLIASFIWATRASIPFMVALVSEEKKLLAVYPVCLYYLFLSWFALVA